MTKACFLIILISSFLLIKCQQKTLPPLSQDLVNFINNKKSGKWKAAFHNKSMTGTIPYICDNSTESEEGIPTCFDSRQKWPHCKSIGHIREQANCGSCWAISAAEVLTDRFCIFSAGKVTPYLSELDLLTCSMDHRSRGCRGGYPDTAWQYMYKRGIVTGGSFEDQTGCRPSPFHPCSHNSNEKGIMCDETKFEETPPCRWTCQNNYSIPYFSDKHFAHRKVFTESLNVKSIQREIMKNGPVQAAMDAYEDFFVYRSGVYHHVGGDRRYGHIVKIIGWGVENESPFWLVANSYSSTWGDHGFFKIARGINECGIEERIIAGYPRLNLSKYSNLFL